MSTKYFCENGTYRFLTITLPVTAKDIFGGNRVVAMSKNRRNILLSQWLAANRDNC
jgi:hypothetical protein